MQLEVESVRRVPCSAMWVLTAHPSTRERPPPPPLHFFVLGRHMARQLTHCSVGCVQSCSARCSFCTQGHHVVFARKLTICVTQCVCAPLVHDRCVCHVSVSRVVVCGAAQAKGRLVIRYLDNVAALSAGRPGTPGTPVAPGSTPPPPPPPPPRPLALVRQSSVPRAGFAFVFARLRALLSEPGPFATATGGILGADLPEAYLQRFSTTAGADLGHDVFLPDLAAVMPDVRCGVACCFCWPSVVDCRVFFFLCNHCVSWLLGLSLRCVVAVAVDSR